MHSISLTRPSARAGERKRGVFTTERAADAASLFTRHGRGTIRCSLVLFAFFDYSFGINVRGKKGGI